MYTALDKVLIIFVCNISWSLLCYSIISDVSGKVWLCWSLTVWQSHGHHPDFRLLKMKVGKTWNPTSYTLWLLVHDYWSWTGHKRAPYYRADGNTCNTCKEPLINNWTRCWAADVARDGTWRRTEAPHTQLQGNRYWRSSLQLYIQSHHL